MIAHYFPKNYKEARERFLQFKPELNSFCDSFSVDGMGKRGEDLACDLRIVGAPEAEKALVLLAGTHGVEGFWGSAAQMIFLEEFADKLPPNIKVCLLHALNPWGYSYLHRNTKDNVDLNRAFYSGARITNAAFPAFDTLFGTGIASSQVLLDQIVSINLRQSDREFIRKALFDGQTQNRHAPGFGGNQRPPIQAALNRWIPTHLKHAARMVVVDFHTGIGAAGELILMSQHPPGKNEDLCTSIFPTVKKPNPPATGELGPGIRSEIVRLANNSEAAAVVAELGTLVPPWPGRAILRRVWLHENAATPQGQKDEVDILLDIESAFYLTSMKWQQDAVTWARDILKLAISKI